MTIRAELIWRTSFTTRDRASKAIGQYIEGFYNPRRRHSCLGYISPATFEATFMASQKDETSALYYLRGGPSIREGLSELKAAFARARSSAEPFAMTRNPSASMAAS